MEESTLTAIRQTNALILQNMYDSTEEGRNAHTVQGIKPLKAEQYKSCHSKASISNAAELLVAKSYGPSKFPGTPCLVFASKEALHKSIKLPPCCWAGLAPNGLLFGCPNAPPKPPGPVCAGSCG